jgi:hypothetical protein
MRLPWMSTPSSRSLGTSNRARSGHLSQSRWKRRLSPSERGIESLEARALLSTTYPLDRANWAELGPGPITNGQTPGNDPVSGRIAAVAADPSNPNTLFIAAAGGGVWKTTDGGANWSARTDGQATLAMGAIAVAPTNSNIIYAGTGEANFSGDSNYGRGVLVSTDGGTTWTLTGANVFDRKAIGKIVVDPTNANIAYAAVGRAVNGVGGFGIYKTTNGGATWANTTASITTGPSYTDVEIDPSNPNVLYAGIGEIFGDSANGVYKSTNGGGSWSFLAAAPGGSADGRITIAISPSNTQVVYVSIQGTGSAGSTSFGSLFRMLRTDDGGSSFTTLSGTPNYLGGQGWYDTTLIVSPTNSAVVFAAGVTGGGGTNGIIESTNSGVSWSSIGQSSSSPFNGPHTDYHGMAFDASNRLLVGNDGGIWRLDNPTIGSIKWTDLNDHINTVQFQGIDVSPTDRNVALGGSQDNGSERFNDNTSWTLTDGGDGGFIRFSQTNPSRVYRVSPIASFGTTAFFRVSNNGGQTWSSATNGLNGNDPTNFYPPFSVDPGNGQRVLFGSNRIYETTNGAANWSPISTVGVGGWNPSGATVNAIGLAASDPNTIYAATSDARIYVTTNHGASWTDRTPGGISTISDVEVDPTNALVAYATSSVFTGDGRHVFRTTNGGGSWSDISGNLPDLPTWTLRIGKTSAGDVLYIGNDDGVYSSADGGTTWGRLGVGMPHAQVLDLSLNPSLEILAAGTHGRGLFELSLAQAPQLATDTSSWRFRVIGPGWSLNSGGFDGSNRSHAAGTGAEYARWTFGTAPGRYEVFATWVPGASNATNATYQVYDGNTLIGSVSVNQALAPNGVLTGGVAFQSLGIFTSTTNTIQVRLSDAANGTVVADGVYLATPFAAAPASSPMIEGGGSMIPDAVGGLPLDDGTAPDPVGNFLGSPVPQPPVPAPIADPSGADTTATSIIGGSAGWFDFGPDAILNGEGGDIPLTTGPVAGSTPESRAVDQAIASGYAGRRKPVELFGDPGLLGPNS